MERLEEHCGRKGLDLELVTIAPLSEPAAERAGDFSGVAHTITDPETGQPFAGNQVPAERRIPASLAGAVAAERAVAGGRAIAQQALCYLRVQPDRVERKQPQRIEVKQLPEQVVADAAEGSISDAGEGGVMVNFRGMSMRQVLQVMEKKGLNVKVLGSGRVVEQNPAAGQKIGPNEQVWVRLIPSA